MLYCWTAVGFTFQQYKSVYHHVVM